MDVPCGRELRGMLTFPSIHPSQPSIEVFGKRNNNPFPSSS